MFGLVQGKTNVIVPGKRPLSSVGPTIVKKGRKTFMVFGSPGGSRIITIVLETIINGCQTRSRPSLSPFRLMRPRH